MPAGTSARHFPLGEFGLRWIPVAALVLVAVTQWILAATVPLSPWIGGGFGMFATVDGNDRVVVTSGVRMDSPEASRHAAAPFSWSARNLLDQSGSDAIEVWSPTFDRATGQLTFERVAQHP